MTDTLGLVDHRWDIRQPQVDVRIRTEHLACRDARQERVGDLSGRAGDDDLHLLHRFEFAFPSGNSSAPPYTASASISTRIVRVDEVHLHDRRCRADVAKDLAMDDRDPVDVVQCPGRRCGS